MAGSWKHGDPERRTVVSADPDGGGGFSIMAVMDHLERRLEAHAAEELRRYEEFVGMLRALDDRLDDLIAKTVPHSPPCQPLLDVHAAFIQDRVTNKPDFVGHRIGHETYETDRKEVRKNIRTIAISVITAATVAAGAWTFYAIKAAAVADIQHSITLREKKREAGTDETR
jgi:hypothetical protein